MLKSLVVVAAGLVAGANAFWRMECPGRVGLARMDPIVSPGAPSAHMHAIHGSSGFSEISGTSDLLAGDCTSCRVTQDKSSYWHPALYFQDAKTNKFEIVSQVGGMLAYYLLYGENVTAFPKDFRMLSGNSLRRTYTLGDPSQPDPEKSVWGFQNQTGQDTLAQRALGFNCLDYDKPPEGSLYRHYLPDKAYIDANCKHGIRLEIMFPSCWKGGNEIDSENHKDHVAFPDLVMTGNCPEDYPVRLPSLFYEVIVNTYAFSGRDGRFVFANGDVTGYGYHADFVMGWDEGFLQEAVNTCTNPSGRIEDCPLFNVVDQAEATQCQMRNVPQVLMKEASDEPLDQLPGNVQITPGDGSVVPGNGPAQGSASTVLPTLPYKPGETVAASESPLPGQVFKESSSYQESYPTSSVATNSADAHIAAVVPSQPTPAPEIVLADHTASFFSTQYITNGRIVSKIFWEEELVYVTQPVESTATVTASWTPAAKHRRHLHGHGHEHRRV